MGSRVGMLVILVCLIVAAVVGVRRVREARRDMAPSAIATHPIVTPK